MPECGFKNDKPECLRKSDSTLLVVVLCIVLALTLGLGFVGYRVYVKIKYENQLNDYWWKIHWEDIQFAGKLSDFPGLRRISLTLFYPPTHRQSKRSQ